MRWARIVNRSVATAMALQAVAVTRAGQVMTDGTVGHAGAISGPDYAVPATLGKQVGPNLFHSFGKFNLDKGETATFTASAATQNILARVTGGGSTIDGTIASRLNTNSSTPHPAAFYLINPAGVIFGPDARLDVGGSFAVTTADTLRLSDGGHFDARTPSAAVLTSAPPSAFGFLSSQPGAITIGSASQSATMTLVTGSNLGIVGGAVNINSTKFLGGSGSKKIGQAGIVSVAAPADVPLDAPCSPALPFNAIGAAVGIANSSFEVTDRINVFGASTTISGGSLLHTDTEFAGAGNIRIRAISLTIDSAIVKADYTGANTVSPNTSTGSIEVACDTFTLIDGGSINSQHNRTGVGGDIRIAVTGDAAIGFGSKEGKNAGIVAAGGGAKATGNIVVTAGSIAVAGGETISTATTAADPGGNVQLDIARTLTLAGGASVKTSTTGKARGGSVALNVADAMSLTNGGQISTTTSGTADAGDISMSTGGPQALPQPGKIQIAGSIVLDGNATFIGSSAASAATGRGGTIRLSTGSLVITDQAQIRDNTSGKSDGGSIFVIAGDILARRGPKGDLNFTGIATDTLIDSARGPSAGNAGSISVVANSVSLLDGASIQSNAFGLGEGGNVAVSAAAILLSGHDTRVTNDTPVGSNIQARQANSASSAAGGTVTVNATSLALLNGAQLTTDTQGAGPAGSVSVTARRLVVDDQHYRNLKDATSISSKADLVSSTGDAGDVTIVAREFSLLNGGQVNSESEGSGDGGNVSIIANRLVASGGYLAAKAATGRGGTVRVSTSGDLSLIRGSLVTTTTAAAGGEIVLQSFRGSVVIADSRISAQANSVGNILISARDQVTISRGRVNANVQNAGGQITIDPHLVLLSESTIDGRANLASGLRNKQDVQVAIEADQFVQSTNSVINSNNTSIPVEVDIAGSLVPLPSALIAGAASLAPQCGVRFTDVSLSSFVVTGRGGQPPEPGGSTPDLDLHGLWDR